MRDPAPSEPNSTFPTYQVPQEASAMRGRASPVQVARVSWGGRADLPSAAPRVPQPGAPSSVISGSSGCPHVKIGNSYYYSNFRMQSVTENCLLINNSVTVPKIQRNDRSSVTHNNNNYNVNNNDNVGDRDKLGCKFGALELLGQDIPNQKSDDLENDLTVELNLTQDNTTINDNANTITKDSPPSEEPHSSLTAIETASVHSRDNDNCDNYYNLDRLIQLSKRTRILERQGFKLALGLYGGGESSLSAGTSGWGTPPQQASSNNSNNSSGWGTANAANPNQTANKSNSNMQQNGQQPPPSSQPNQSAWGQPGGNKPPNGPPVSTTANIAPTTTNNNVNNTTSTNTTKQQLEQLNNMREAIFSHDGWGGHINQDTTWEIPGSPEPPIKLDGTNAPPWKPTVNNGTELWEANLRNGGQPPPQPQQKTPWGHTPLTNIGGTWGEDDDVADTSNVWTGVPSGQQQWGNTGNSGGGMWGAPKKENDWGTAGGAGWGDPRSANPGPTGMDPRDMRPDLRDMRSGSSDPMRMLDPREQIRDMRGDPRGITGRLNGAGAEAFWGQTGPQTNAHHMHHQAKIPMGPQATSGWEEPSPPTQRRTVPNYDDGTSLWGNPQQGANMSRGSGVAGPPGMAAQSRVKPEGSWGVHGRNGSWDETGPGWGDDGSGPWSAKQKPITGPLWDNDIDWGHKQANKQSLTKEMIWNSKQFRTLVDMGYKKEDAESALRIREMNMDDALDMLSTLRSAAGMESWRGRHEDHYDHQATGPFPGQRFPTGPTAQMPFPPGGNAPNLLNNMNNPPSGANNSSLINNMSPAIVQKMLAQSGGSQGFAGTGATPRTLQTQSTPTQQQLRMLVQQIQMAVQAGYLNHQILNQPLAPQTLVFLNQLLQQIKTLQQLLNQQSMAQQQTSMGGGKASNMLLQCSVLITKTKQQIANLQNQIAAQQAIYVKQQQQQLTGGVPGGPSDLYKTNAMHDSINALQNNFADLGIKDPQVSQQQSRLNQWKLPVLDKEDPGEFSRAPGSSSKPLTASHSSPNLNPLPLGLTQPDGPWSNGRTGDTGGGWPESSTNDSVAADNKDGQWPAPSQTSITDLVPEFEPGKPWKGPQMKSIEDDPSITPGSVVRSPLSIPTIKDPELFSMNSSKNSPPGGDAIQPVGLSSSTWSFNPPSSTPSAFTSPQNKLPASKGVVGDLNPSTAVTSELWATKSRGPPPGLVVPKGSALNGWTAYLRSNAWSLERAPGSWGCTSPWLLLRNLTAQIDGSTLRTLCMQHGPLQNFQLYLHQGYALAKYSSREEAAKAQTALNNCVLGNTTILAENPSDWEANTLLQQAAPQQSGTSGGWRNPGKPASDTWSSGWPNAATATSLWGSSTLDSGDHQARGTPSNLNSFLPGDLLGSGESI
ncbi:protein Gawky isoform X2 [Agrilus planipennis]|uniref:Protein Gawky isoform X2 n=1 Tax=Agrilus planipennis TaxID=224129 RepID=A0A1W4X3B6_AGRPL|nr:protein Gawky isoform X2 [Agrilus planipennis]